MIIIDAGHGGWDPGGGSNEYFKEKEMTKKISDYQKRRFDELVANGGEVPKFFSLLEDIQKRGTIVLYNNGGGQSGYAGGCNAP